jgi:Flp pilus assembly protein TadG
MKAIVRALGQSERGSSLVEMALVGLLLLTMVAGIVDLGRAYGNHVTILNASREGARYGSRFPFDRAGIAQAVRQEAANSGLPVGDISTSVAGLNGMAGQPIGVTVHYDSPTILGALIGRPHITVQATTRMVIFGIE